MTRDQRARLLQPWAEVPLLVVSLTGCAQSVTFVLAHFIAPQVRVNSWRSVNALMCGRLRQHWLP